MGIVGKMAEYGADEICLKDMAGVGRPAMLGELVRQIKSKYPGILVQYHGHSGPGMSVASMLEVARAGADFLDVAMEPLSWGMVHPDLLAIHAIMKDAGFDVPDINMDAYMKVRSLTQDFINDFLGYFIDNRNRQMTSLLIGSGLPGGMMGSLMADLKGVHQGINTTLKNLGKPSISEDQLLVDLFREVEYIWPMLGYPPLVTPFSQYVKNVALMNIVQINNGKERFGMIDNNTWDMILGKAGKLPGPLDEKILELAGREGKIFFNGVPQDNYPDALPAFREEMIKNGWDLGVDEEELFELAMHDRQYRDYKSGVAKTRFIAEVEGKKNEAAESATVPETNKKVMVSPYNGTVLLYVGSGEYYLGFYQEVDEGCEVVKNQRLLYIESGRQFEEVLSDRAGKIKKILCNQGDFVTKGTPLVEFA
jgi:pyruvate carboxylase subunit B